MSTDVKFPEVDVQLTGQDGNAFAIIGAVQKALRRAEHDGTAPAGAAAQYAEEAMNSESYDALLQHAMATVNVS
jgi:hypothetical protein